MTNIDDDIEFMNRMFGPGPTDDQQREQREREAQRWCESFRDSEAIEWADYTAQMDRHWDVVEALALARHHCVSVYLAERQLRWHAGPGREVDPEVEAALHAVAPRLREHLLNATLWLAYQALGDWVQAQDGRA